MSFDVLVIPALFEKVPAEFKDNIKSIIKKLKNPFPGEDSNKKKIKGAGDSAYRLRVGNYLIFYRIDRDRKKVYVFDIFTSEQAHKKYGRL
jgi:mRNA interferase RelE/StbE